MKVEKTPVLATGVQAGFDFDKFQQAIATGGIYCCVGNEMCLDPLFRMSPGILCNRSALLQLAANTFNQGGLYLGTTVVLVSEGGRSPMEDLGAFRRVSPEEFNWARMIGIDASIREGAGKTS